MKSGSSSSYRAALSGTGADIGGEREEETEMVVVEDLRLRPALTLKGLPWGVVVPYVGTLPNGVTFAIFHPEKDWDYNSFRCVFGANDGTVKEVTVKKVIRYRDGGTTDIETAVGNFHFPSCFNREDKATFDREPITVEER